MQVPTNTSANIITVRGNPGIETLSITTFGWRWTSRKTAWKQVYRSKGRRSGMRVKWVRQ